MTLLVRPPQSLEAVLTVKGAGGEGQHGRRSMLVLSLSGLLLFRMAARALCGLLNQDPPRSSWATRPHVHYGWWWSWGRRMGGKGLGVEPKKFKAPSAPPPITKQPNCSLAKQPIAPQPNSQGKTNSPRAKGKRAQAPRREPGGAGQYGRRPSLKLTLSGRLLSRQAARQ